MSANPHQALAAHLKTRPEMPRPIPAFASKEWQTYRAAIQEWVDELQVLEAKVATHGLSLELDRQPRCLPRAELYNYNDPDERPRTKRPSRPAWVGATPEYQREKAAQRRAGINAKKEARAELIREALRERSK